MANSQDIYITTKDNPYSPFTQFDEWYMFDKLKGYNTLEYLDRIMTYSPNISDNDQDIDISDAMREIAQYNLTGNYILVTRDT